MQDFDHLTNDRMLNEAELIEKKSVQVSLWGWFKKKEMYWAQQSRSKWLKEKDCNTKYIHSIASIHKKRNNIDHLIIYGASVKIWMKEKVRQ